MCVASIDCTPPELIANPHRCNEIIFLLSLARMHSSLRLFWPRYPSSEINLSKSLSQDPHANAADSFPQSPTSTHVSSD